MKTPRSKWVLVGWATLWFLTAPVVALVHYSTELTRGSLPADADSIAIPLWQETLGLVMLSPLLALLLWRGVRRYRGASPWAAWSDRAPLRAVGWTLALGGLALMFCFEAIRALVSGQPLSMLHESIGAYVAFNLRAAIVGEL